MPEGTGFFLRFRRRDPHDQARKFFLENDLAGQPRGLASCRHLRQQVDDIVGSLFKLDHKRAVLAAKIGMLAITLLAAWLASRTITHLVNLAILSYQGIIQLAVPQYLGIFWMRGTARGALSGTFSGCAVAIALQVLYPAGISWAWGLTSGILALLVNAAVYAGCAVLFPHTQAEHQRVRDLFALTDDPKAGPTALTAIAVHSAA